MSKIIDETLTRNEALGKALIRFRSLLEDRRWAEAQETLIRAADHVETDADQSSWDAGFMAGDFIARDCGEWNTATVEARRLRMATVWPNHAIPAGLVEEDEDPY